MIEEPFITVSPVVIVPPLIDVKDTFSPLAFINVAPFLSNIKLLFLKPRLTPVLSKVKLLHSPNQNHLFYPY